MKLLSINLARSIWLGPMLDFNPKGVRLDYFLYPLLINTYKFRKFPSINDAQDLVKGVSFGDGEFIINDQLTVNLSITFYNDGIVVDTRSSTDHSDGFLDDFFRRVSEEVDIPPYSSVLKETLYLSQVFISPEKSLETLNSKLKHISKYLTQHTKGNNDFQTSGLSFWPDQTKKRNLVPFTFERAANTPFEDNRYYSSAPLQTNNHLELLDILESIFK